MVGIVVSYVGEMMMGIDVSCVDMLLNIDVSCVGIMLSVLLCRIMGY